MDEPLIHLNGLAFPMDVFCLFVLFCWCFF